MPLKEAKNQKISIVLPNYNSSQHITQTINSILKQSYKNWELILVDDCSDNKTKKILLCSFFTFCKIKPNPEVSLFGLKIRLN